MIETDSPSRREDLVRTDEGPKSKFTFEERRRYAQNQQPPLGNGWLVESASGRYDEVIAAWSGAQNPPAKKSETDFKDCPDCGGSGMYYPEGFDKGAAKCRHERLGERPREGPRRLSAEEIAERTALIRELIEDGYTLEQATRQFGASMHAEDWAAVESGVRGEGRESSDDV